MTIHIRPERSGDEADIHELTAAAFAGKPYADGTEAPIIDRLRTDGDLTVSLVALDGSEIVGHVAFSPVRIGDPSWDWYGLGPISVRPDRQRQGFGRAMIEEGLRLLRARGAAGCALIGDPKYYGRFGFEGDCGLTYRDLSATYVQALSFGSAAPKGELEFARAFTGAGTGSG